MKHVFVPSSLMNAFGIVDLSYDRGAYIARIKRNHLSKWRHGVFWYDASVFSPDTLQLHFRAVDFVEFLFNNLSYEE